MLSKTSKQADTIADEKYDKYEVTEENVSARKTFMSVKSEVGWFLFSNAHHLHDIISH